MFVVFDFFFFKGKFVKEEDIMKMKAYFKIPFPNEDCFDDIEYAELGEDDARRQVEQLVTHFIMPSSKHNEPHLI